MSELTERLARVAVAELDGQDKGASVWEEDPLDDLLIDGPVDLLAMARVVAGELLAAQAEWARTASPSDVGDPDFFEEGLRGFARANGLEMGKDDD
jgi:hypothetical protein